MLSGLRPRLPGTDVTVCSGHALPLLHMWALLALAWAALPSPEAAGGEHSRRETGCSFGGWQLPPPESGLQTWWGCS